MYDAAITFNKHYYFKKKKNRPQYSSEVCIHVKEYYVTKCRSVGDLRRQII